MSAVKRGGARPLRTFCGQGEKRYSSNAGVRTFWPKD